MPLPGVVEEHETLDDDELGVLAEVTPDKTNDAEYGTTNSPGKELTNGQRIPKHGIQSRHSIAVALTKIRASRRSSLTSVIYTAMHSPGDKSDDLRDFLKPEQLETSFKDVVVSRTSVMLYLFGQLFPVSLC